MKDKKETIRFIGGVNVDTSSNLVVDNTIHALSRRYYGSEREGWSCIDENGKFINTEMFSPVITDREQQPPAYQPAWELYDDASKKGRKLITIEFSEAYKKYWYEQRKRCMEGYEVGGVRLTGAHYFYLNFWRIKGKKIGSGWISPSFLDLDKQFFDLIEKAQIENKNVLFLKRRQIGFSEKLACLMGYFYTFYPGAVSIVVAGEEKYSDGTFKKCSDGLNAFSPDAANAAREFYKLRIKDDSESIESGFRFNSTKVGYNSAIRKFTLKDNPAAVNGQSPVLTVMEESGLNRFLKAAYKEIDPAIKERGKRDGRIIVIVGTGGEMEASVKQMKDMFYNPKTYDLLSVPNVWDKDGFTGECSPFFPATLYHVMDNDGNSYEEASRILINEEREAVRSDPAALIGKKTQFPLMPSEAFMSSAATLFNTDLLMAQERRIEELGISSKVQHGRLDWIMKDGVRIGVTFTPSGADKYEKDASGDLLYPYIIVEHPLDTKVVDGKRQRLFNQERIANLYVGGTDSYDKESAASSDSVGSCSIFKSYYPGDQSESFMFVARYTERPHQPDKFFERTAMLNAYYHESQNLIEYSNVSIFDWYKRAGLVNLLAKRPIYVYANIEKSVVNNVFGVDPNTKFVWENSMIGYINQYSDRIYDLEQLDRFMHYRQTQNGRKYNCDITVGSMLAYVNYKNLEARKIPAGESFQEQKIRLPSYRLIGNNIY